jgi:hypothetical protein
MSFRDTALNLTMWRDQDSGAIIPMTLRNQAERHGEKITSAISQKAEQALSKAGFNNDVKQLTQKESSDWLRSCALAPDEVIKAAEEAKIKGYDVADYEDPSKVLNIYADDICVKAQNPKRPMPQGMEKKKRVDTTVVHLQSNAGQYTLAGSGIGATLRMMMGFLAFNNLLHSQPIVFFTDGARVIHNEIERMFGFVSYKLVLDWFHLMKKFAEGFSMAFKGKKIRNAQLSLVEKLLWFGNVDKAISFLRNVDPSLVKSRVQLEQLIDYLNRVRQYIPNYALRKKLGLCNSSNRVEKANDLVVAKRQKRNGTSWSQQGSIGMASVTCTSRNGELDNWVKNRTIQFTPIPQLDEAA